LGVALHGARVLIVEDDFLIALELEEILREAGAAEVRQCRTLAEAMRSVPAGDCSVAILDFRLGRESTLPLARELSCLGVPFVFYTGQMDANPILAEWPHCTVLSKPSPAYKIVAALAASRAD
jgi:DNA-binding NtrC family response regulator